MYNQAHPKRYKLSLYDQSQPNPIKQQVFRKLVPLWMGLTVYKVYLHHMRYIFFSVKLRIENHSLFEPPIICIFYHDTWFDGYCVARFSCETVTCHVDESSFQLILATKPNQYYTQVNTYIHIFIS